MTEDEIAVDDYLGDRQIRVYAPCARAWIDERKTTFVDISESIQGADVLTFACPLCGELHQSERRG